MTHRSYALGLAIVAYSGFAVSGALFAAGSLAHVGGGDALLVFLSVLTVLWTAAGVVGARLLVVFERAWDRQFDETGTSWAVREAERILQKAGEQR
ncbi:hypothetical protein [Streptacidiphilus jiangxiensis]|uniref:Uncharacterized protein n=1 Tax=Streptacidiphilus jiangxiensis TaxID=235985 RepID=A0A1H7ZDY8_STRJI|nr:hypothetical protein [Streptacidiphilus jiangxiensis]SEM56483.1 hypothetical protein SAMN05414137_13453 [Streptacidiphilus jiangxiensis]